MGAIDSDYAWLKTHLKFSTGIESRRQLADRVANSLIERINGGQLPYTLGIFGGWGTGKTTFLAMLADRLEGTPGLRVVYFNSWKYAGFMEIVPSLIFKILEYGVKGGPVEGSEAARRVILALGKKYGDQIGDWAKTKMGVNPVELFKDIYKVSAGAQAAVGKLLPEIKPEVVRAYYTQVDKAQDELRIALGTVSSGERPKNVVVVLIDELDRCDPDEAFNVIKQMRVLFGMRDLPVAFVIGANAEPIGLAIKHRYGLESDSSDYEARRILEKFVDSYEDLSQGEALGALIKEMWTEKLPWIVDMDVKNGPYEFAEDVQSNATAFDAITTSVPLFSNIRVLYKSYERVRLNVRFNAHLLWTKWFLEIANQIDPRFRRDLRMLAGPLGDIVETASREFASVSCRTIVDGKRRKLEFQPKEKGNTLFAIFRSLFWDSAKVSLSRLRQSDDPEQAGRSQALQRLLSDSLRVDFVVLLSLLPFKSLPSFRDLSWADGPTNLGVVDDLESLIAEFSDSLVE